MPDELDDLPQNLEPCSTDENRTMVKNPELDRILDQYLDDLQNGRACSREELLSQHEDLADDLAEYLDGIEMVSGLGVGSDLVPQKLGDFEIVRPIGRGAMGVVYLANQISLKRPVALKVLRYSVTGKQATARFEREAELVATLQHSNIVPIYATGKNDNLHFLAMQLIDGPSLSQWSAGEDADRNPVTLAKWGSQVARALAHAHQRDVIHRDVKPSNLLQDNDQKIWLTDFGLARRFDDLRMSMTGAMLGTPNYMSPEQVSPSRYPIDHRTDIYSLGATLYELLTGRCVFLAETPHGVLAQVLTEDALPLRELLPNVSRDLETILMKCLEKEPGDRYQTADQLADDLEAFAEGRSIKARRPSIIEQAVRWKRHNQKAVSWAMTAAATAVTALAISVAAWIGWTNSQLGRLKVGSDEGPIVGRLIDANGEPTPTFTIPTQQPMSVKEGRYTLQMWSGGKLGENQELFVEHGKLTECKTKLSDIGVFAERTVQGIPAVLPQGDRDDFIFFHEKGITRVDGRTGRDLWTADAKDFVKAANTPSEAKQKNKRNKKSQERGSVPRIKWMNIQNLVAYDDRRLPVVAHGFPDINQDGEREALIASHTHLALFAFDGKTGELQWNYVADREIPDGGRLSPHSKMGSVDRPCDIGDIDGDGVNDFATTFFAEGDRVYRWLDAVSGRTGKRIWRLNMSEKWFDKKPHIVSKFCEIDPHGRPFRHMHSVRGYRSGTIFRNSSRGFVVPWPSIFIPTEKESGTESLLLVCGTKLIICDPKTGEATDFNRGQPLELGFIPALTPKLVRSGSESDVPIGVLLCEQIAIADSQTTTKPVTRFSMWSLETAQKIWHYDAACDPGWTGVAPDWPLVADLAGDSMPEILIADGADLEKRLHSGASCFASLQALDARTGKAVWNKNDVAQIRNQDRQVQKVLLGPDADGDQQDDVYVVSPMSIQGRKPWIFVDILSGVSGKLIRSTKSDPPIAESGFAGIDLQTPFFLGVGADGFPRLVVSTKRIDSSLSRQSTLTLSTGTGKMTHLGDQLEHPLRADGDGDGDFDLFLIKPRSATDLTEAGQLVSLKPLGGREKKFAGARFMQTDDVDGDGVRDLVTDPKVGGTVWQALSGATGQQLWRWTYQPRGDGFTSLNKDVDGDNIDDYLVNNQSFGRRGHRLTLTLVSGHGGQVLWQKDLPIDDGFATGFQAKCDDMNADGVNDLMLIHRFGNAQIGGTGGSVRVSCLDGKSGAEHWSSELVATGSNVAGSPFQLERYPMGIFDVNSDGSPDICFRRFAADGTSRVTALSGHSGELLWQQATAAMPIRNYQFPIWRTKVLATGPEQQKQIVTAESSENNAKPVKITFYDFENKQPASTWSGEGRLDDHLFPSNSQLGVRYGIPFEITAGEKSYTGICVQSQRGPDWQIVVLDSSQGTAIEVQRIDLPRIDNVGRELAQRGHFLLADVNQDGRTDAIFHDGSDLIAVDLINNQEVNRKSMPADDRRLLAVDPETSLIQLIARTDDDTQFKLIDINTFDVVWDLNVPPDAKFAGLLSGGQPDESNVHIALPRVLYESSVGTTRTIATTAEYMGNDAAIRQKISLGAAEPVSLTADGSLDPRMIEPLPWAGGNLPSDLANGLLQMAANTALIVLGAFVFPFFYVRYMVRKKRWSLQNFLLLPLLFVIPYLALQLPLETSRDMPAYEAASEFGWQLWMGKLLIASLVLPTIVFVGVWIKHLWSGDWKRLARLSIVAIVLSIAMGGLMLWGRNHQFPVGSHYDWYDWGTVMLIAYGSWFAGLGIIGIWIFISTGRFVFRLWKRIFSRPTLVTS